MLNSGLDKQELLRIVEAVANEKSIDKEIVIGSMETAIQKALPACWQQLEPGKLKETKVMNKIEESHKKLEDKKKAFDEKNKTLWDIFKNSNK